VSGEARIVALGEKIRMNRSLAPVLAGLVALGAAPASASLIGTTASTTIVGAGLSVAPGSTTVVSPGAEFAYDNGGSAFLSGNVEPASFLLAALSLCRCGDLTNGITLTLDPGPLVITGFTAVVTGFAGFDASDISLSGSTLTLALSDFFASTGDSVLVNFTFADPTGVPLPASAALFGAGLLGLLGVARKRAG
jgi:hypothetical protein